MSNSNAVVASLPTDDDGSCSDTAINANNNLQPIALLVDELRSDQLQARLNAYKKLPVISLALGAERTRVELVPFLQSKKSIILISHLIFLFFLSFRFNLFGRR